MKRLSILSSTALLIPLLISLMGCAPESSPEPTPEPLPTPVSPSPMPQTPTPPQTIESEAIPTPTPNPEPSQVASPVCSELGEGWTTYESDETGIRFCYPQEWGEVKDYIDYFKETIIAGWQEEAPSQITPTALSEWETAARDAGDYLYFSNFEPGLGPAIKIISAEKMQSFMAHVAEVYSSPQYSEVVRFLWRWPLLGYFGGVLVMMPEFKGKFPEPLTEQIKNIAILPDGAPTQELQDTALPVFSLFSGAMRDYNIWYAAASDGEAGVFETKLGQITAFDKGLRGVTEVGSEGFDTATDYWDCLLVTTDGTQLVYLSFPINLPPYDSWDNPAEWAMGDTPPKRQAAIDEETRPLLDFAMTITLIK